MLSTLYIIHHTHTDLGFTHDPPIVWDLHGRFIERAIELAEKYASDDADHSFRWTLECTCTLMEWLRHASPGWVKRFQAMERAGRLEATAMFCNGTSLPDIDELVESFRPVRQLRAEYGVSVRHAMNADVNGLNWGIVDVLLDLGIQSVSMAINTHFGGAPLTRPSALLWKGPSGRVLPAWNGNHYDGGWAMYRQPGEPLTELQECGTSNWRWVRPAQDFKSGLFANEWLTGFLKNLEQIGYQWPIAMVQAVSPFGDNAPPHEQFCRFIEKWNEEGNEPRLVLATPSMWWKEVAPYLASAPTYGGDWTDFWTFGVGSCARETAIVRASRQRLRNADLIAGLLAPLTQEESQLSRSLTRYRDAAWQDVGVFHEHTFEVDRSISEPWSEDAAVYWQHKAGHAYRARSASLLLQRDAVAELAGMIEPGSPDDLLLFNPLPWKRTVSGEVPGPVESPRGWRPDAAGTRHSQDAMEMSVFDRADATPEGTIDPLRYILPPTEVPAMGYCLVSRQALQELKGHVKVEQDAIIETKAFRVVFDREQGGIRSLYDKQLGRELVDSSSGYTLNSFVHEEVADQEHRWPRRLMFAYDSGAPRGWKPQWLAKRINPERVLLHRVYYTPLGVRVYQRLRAAGCEGALEQITFIPLHDRYIECESRWQMGLNCRPEANYVLFPLDIPGATARVDLGGQAMQPERDQIPGVCRDWFNVQNWSDLSNGEFGVTIATPDTPLIQFGGFQFARNQSHFELGKAMLLGWVTNNYWETNFRPHQPGRVSARFRISPYAGPFDESRAHRVGMEARSPAPLMQQMAEFSSMRGNLPQSGSLLEISNQEIQVLHLLPWAGRGMMLRLYNPAGVQRSVRVSSTILSIDSASHCDLLGNAFGAIPVEQSSMNLDLPAGRITCVHIRVSVPSNRRTLPLTIPLKGATVMLQHNRKHSRNRKVSAFTLVELLVVIGIIALLISILLPSLARARQSALDVQCLSNFKQHAQALMMYAGDNKGKLPERSEYAQNWPWSWDAPLLTGSPYSYATVEEVAKIGGPASMASPLAAYGTKAIAMCARWDFTIWTWGANGWGFYDYSGNLRNGWYAWSTTVYPGSMWMKETKWTINQYALENAVSRPLSAFIHSSDKMIAYDVAPYHSKTQPVVDITNNNVIKPREALRTVAFADGHAEIVEQSRFTGWSTTDTSFYPFFTDNQDYPERGFDLRY